MSSSSEPKPVRSPSGIGCEHYQPPTKKRLAKTLRRVQFGWPLGMPLVGHVEGGIWEVRTRLDGRIARTLFVTESGVMILLHAFIKKQQKTPQPELSLAQERLKQLRRQK